MVKSLRDDMPLVAEFIDAAREVFGAAEINAQIKLGLSGHRTFWARENGIEVGSRFARLAENTDGRSHV